MAEQQSVGSILNNILTRGLDVVEAVQLRRLEVADPTPNTSGPSGRPTPAGEGANFSAAFQSVPGWMWAAGVGLIALALWKR